MVQSMVGLEFAARLNEILGDADGDEYAAAQSAVETADTVRDALEASGVLDRLESDDGRAEARAVFELMPPALDEAIIAALENAFERRVPIAVEWIRSDDELIEVRVAEDLHGDGQRVRIALVSPEGRWFLERLSAS
jgi:hypothetical protein